MQILMFFRKELHRRISTFGEKSFWINIKWIQRKGAKNEVKNILFTWKLLKKKWKLSLRDSNEAKIFNFKWKFLRKKKLEMNENVEKIINEQKPRSKKNVKHREQLNSIENYHLFSKLKINAVT